MNHKFIPFKKEDISQERFYRVPKAFVEDEYFKTEMDSNMKLMYSLLRDRYELSIKNNWIDQDGIVYCLYSREHLADDINVSDNTIRKCINKLTELNLMKEVRKGQGKPNFMYISKVESSYSLRPSKNEVQEHQKMNPSDTELSETENKNKGSEKFSPLLFHQFVLNRQPRPETVEVVTYYLDYYYDVYGIEHPRLKDEQWQRVVNNLFSVDEYDLSEMDLKNMIEQHFKTEYDNCDYNILHFISDGVMLNRMYEVAY